MAENAKTSQAMERGEPAEPAELAGRLAWHQSEINIRLSGTRLWAEAVATGGGAGRPMRSREDLSAQEPNVTSQSDVTKWRISHLGGGNK